METDRATRVHAMLVHSIAVGGELRIVYGFKDPPTVQDLAKIDQELCGWIRLTLREEFGFPPQQIPTLALRILASQDDGNHAVTVSLDFGTLLPGERPPELLAAADEMLAHYEE